MNIRKTTVLIFVLVIAIALLTGVYAYTIGDSSYLANEVEWETLKVINKARLSNGILPLSLTEKMMGAAGQRVEELVELYAEDRPDGSYAYTLLDELNITYSAFGQCIAQDVNEPTSLVSLWLDSKYKKSILNPEYTHAGIAESTASGDLAFLMTGSCIANNINVVSDRNAGTYTVGTDAEDFGEYIILTCGDHERSYMPIVSEMISGYDSTKLGVQTLTVAYSNLKVNFRVEIVDSPPEPSPSDDPSPSPSTSPSPLPITYIDVPDDIWYTEAVKFVTQQGLFSGTSENEFSPEVSLTRGMFVTVLARLSENQGENVSEFEYINEFKDVPSDKWYCSYVGWASAKGIVNGYDKYTFGPEDIITREQMAVIFTRYSEYASIKLPVGEASFTDSSQISPWAEASVGIANASGLIQGHADGSFKPLDDAIRAQAAIIFQRYMLNYLDK